MADPLFDLRTNPFFLQFADIADRGSSEGAFYDQGVRFVVDQVRQTGSFVPSALKVLRRDFAQDGSGLDPTEIARFEAELVARGMTKEQGKKFGKGIADAEVHISSLKIDEDEDD